MTSEPIVESTSHNHSAQEHCNCDLYHAHGLGGHCGTVQQPNQLFGGSAEPSSTKKDSSTPTGNLITDSIIRGNSKCKTFSHIDRCVCCVLEC